MATKSRLTVRRVQDITVAALTDRSVVDTQLIENVRRELFALVEASPQPQLLFDLSKVEHLSSTALGVLIPLREEVGKRKGKLMLCGVRPEIMKVFKITRLDKLFEFRPSVDDALTALAVR